MTAQACELFIFEEEIWSMDQRSGFPEGHRLIRRARPVAPAPADAADGALPQRVWIESSACWRGYVGTWTVDRGRLYLVQLAGRWRVLEGKRVFASWYSGELLVGGGQLLHQPRRAYGLTHEREMVIVVEQGRVLSMRGYDNRGKSPDELYIPQSRHPRRSEKLRLFLEQLDTTP